MSPPNLAALLAQQIAVFLAGFDYYKITTSLYSQVKSDAGVFGGITVGVAGTSSSADIYDGLSSTITVTIAVPGVVTWTAHGLAAGDAVKFTTTGALPTGITAGTTYYVSVTSLTADAFKLSDTRAHALAGTNIITTTGSQSGVHTGWDVTRPMFTFSTTAQANVPAGASGTRFSHGLIVVTADGGGAADITVSYL